MYCSLCLGHSFPGLDLTPSYPSCDASFFRKPFLTPRPRQVPLLGSLIPLLCICHCLRIGLSTPLDCDSLENRVGTVLVLAGSLTTHHHRSQQCAQNKRWSLIKEMSLLGEEPSAGVAVVSDRGRGHRLESETPEFKSPVQVGDLDHNKPHYPYLCPNQ